MAPEYGVAATHQQQSAAGQSASTHCSVGDSELCSLEVAGLLGSSESDGLLLGLGEAEAGSLSALGAEVRRGAALLLPGLLGLGSSLLVDDGEVAGDGLSDNLKK